MVCGGVGIEELGTVDEEETLFWTRVGCCCLLGSRMMAGIAVRRNGT